MKRLINLKLKKGRSIEEDHNNCLAIMDRELQGGRWNTSVNTDEFIKKVGKHM